jgi:hypothetical protein
MNTQKSSDVALKLTTQFKNLHLHLGLTRTELRKRLELGLIDPQILNTQINESSKELKLNALCESWIESHSVEQAEIECARVDFGIEDN